MHQHLVATNLRKLLLRTTELLAQEYQAASMCRQEPTCCDQSQNYGEGSC